MNLDEIVARSAPAVAQRTAELEHSLDQLVTATEERARGPRGRRRTGFVVAATVGTIGLTTVAAAAAGFAPSWAPWSTTAGSACQMEFGALPKGDDGEPATVEYSADEQRRAAADARQFLANLDLSTVDVAQAIKTFRAGEDAAIEGAPAGEQQPRLTGDEREITAVGQVVWQRLERHLVANGVSRPADAITFSQGWRCR